MKWNTNLYDSKHDFVSRYGEELIELLAPKKGETVLDVGCGTGDLAALISRQGATVIGLDSSGEMIEVAKKKYPHIHFDIGSADAFCYNERFDAVFSNATLHWVLKYEEAARCMYNALKSGGRLVVEFGGKGNVINIVNALKEALYKRGYNKMAAKEVWYFPSLSAYTQVLEQNGFRVVYAAHFDRPTLLRDDKGIQNWLQMFAQSYLENIDKEVVDDIMADVEEQIRTTNFKDGNWYADYVRLRVLAIRQ